MSTCFNIGFKAYCRNVRENSLNIIQQLKVRDVIKNYDWSIIFENNNNKSIIYPEQGVFLIGAKPHEYNRELFNENDLFGSGSISDELLPFFNFKINDVYFESNNSEKIYITNFDIVQLIPTYGLIKGPQNYESLLETYFFNNFISEKKCFKEYQEKDNLKSFRTFVCNNTEDIKKELKQKFPTLKLKQKNFLYTFELNYDDLFKEKGDKIYFLVWFSSHIATSWELGHPFTKKYLFNYNYDNKYVYFYNKIKYDEDDKNQPSNDNYVLKIVVVVILLIVATCIGFIIGALFKRRKKSVAQELESEKNTSLFEDNEK